MPSWNNAIKQRLIHPEKTASTKRMFKPIVLIPAAAACAAILALVLFNSSPAVNPSEQPTAQGSTPNAPLVANADGFPVPTKLQAGSVAIAPPKAAKSFAIGKDQLGLDASGQFVVEQASPNVVQVHLKKGRLACEVNHRNKDGKFTVVHGDYAVKVVGTRFSVSSDPKNSLLVSVVNGKVEVRGPGNLLETVQSGETLKIQKQNDIQRSAMQTVERDAIESLLSTQGAQATNGSNAQNGSESTDIRTDESTQAAQLAKSRSRVSSTSKTNPLPHWQKMIIQGQYKEAESQLKSHLKRSPRDADAWWLLATCRRKSGNWPGAVDAYDKVIATANGARADKARYRAATILQEKQSKHKSALPYFERYLQGASANKPLRAEAMTRQAESLLALGRKKQAKQILSTVIRDYGNNPSSARAKQVLNKMQ